MDKDTVDLVKLRKFFLIIFFKGWKSVFIADIVTIIGFIVTPMFNPEATNIALYIALGIIVFTFILKIIIQFYSYFSYYSETIMLKNIVQGAGLYNGNNIFCFDSSCYVQKNMLITLYTNSSGVRQPICVLQVIDVIYDTEFHAIQVSPTSQTLNVSSVYQHEVLNRKLFAIPHVSTEMTR